MCCWTGSRSETGNSSTAFWLKDWIFLPGTERIWMPCMTVWRISETTQDLRSSIAESCKRRWVSMENGSLRCLARQRRTTWDLHLSWILERMDPQESSTDICNNTRTVKVCSSACISTMPWWFSAIMLTDSSPCPVWPCRVEMKRPFTLFKTPA